MPYNDLKNVHDALHLRWEAAGSPAHSTQLCLWEMEQFIDDGIPSDFHLKTLLQEGVGLLDEWAALGQPLTDEEVAALLPARQRLLDAADQDEPGLPTLK